MRKFLALLLSIFLFVGVLAPVWAQEEQEPQEVNSFELFWPMVAGKSPGDSLYGLKRLKENVRGALIFSSIKKADYLAFLATKRVLEAEKLKNDGKADLAKKALVQAAKDIEKSNAKLDKSVKNGEQGSQTRAGLAGKLNNLETFLKWYLVKEPDLKEETQSLLDKVINESGKI